MNPPKTLADIKPHPKYPFEKLDGCTSVLALFAAGFHGANDVIYAHKAGIRDVTCVDTDQTRIMTMHRLYPSSWQYAISDAFLYAHQAARNHQTWDAVMVDPPTSLTPLALDELETWLALTRRILTLGFIEDDLPDVRAPHGWTPQIIHRNTTARWLVLEAQ